MAYSYANGLLKQMATALPPCVKQAIGHQP